MSNTIRLTWTATINAKSYNIYHSIRQGLSTRFTPLLINVTDTAYNHVGLLPGNHYYIIAAIGANGEIGTPSNEILLSVSNVAILVSIAVTAGSISGNTQHFIATGTYNDSSTADVTSTSTWGSTNSSIISIDSTGLGTYNGAAGTATVSATIGLVIGNLNISGGSPIWEQKYSNNSPAANIWGITGHSAIVVAEYDTATPEFIRSTNSGTSWSIRPGASNHFAQNSQGRMFDSGTTMFATGTLGTANLEYSTDNGQNWIGISVDSQSYINDIHGTGSSNIYLCGSSGVYQSTDDGNTWAQVLQYGGGGGNVVNGNFEAGSLTGWTSQISTGGTGTTTATTTNPHAGIYAAQIGNIAAYGGDASIRQNITLPSSGTLTLSFWFRISGTDSISFDWYQALVRDSAGTSTLIDLFAGQTGSHGTYASPPAGSAALAGSPTFYANTNTFGTAWHNVTADLSAYAGQTIQLFFLSRDDNSGGDPSYLAVDDITISGGIQSIPTGTITSLYVQDATHVWLGGNGALYKWNGTSLSSNMISTFSLPGGSASHISRQGIWAADNNNIWTSILNSDSSDGYVYRTINGGTTWTNVPFSIGTTAFLASPRQPILGPSSGDAEHVYVGSSGNHLYYHHLGDWIDTQRPSAGDGEVFDLWSPNGTDVYHTSSAYIGHSPGSIASIVPVSVAVHPTAYSFKVGASTIQYKAYATDAAGVVYDITSIASWSSTVTGVATVNSSGGVTPNYTGVASFTHITATLLGVSSFGTLTETGLSSIAVTPSNPTVNVTATQQMTATATYADTTTANITTTVSWTSGTPAKATINASTGLLTGVAAGSSLITATFGAISGTTTATMVVGWSVLYDKANQPTSPPSGYSSAPATGGGIATFVGMAKVGSTLVAANAVQAWFNGAGTSGNYPFLTSTDNGATWAFTSWAQASDANMALDGGSFYATDIWATSDKFLAGGNGNHATNIAASTDGITWSLAVHAGTNIKSIAAFHSTSNANIWAVCDGPTTGTVVVFNSTDDGATWTQPATLTSGGSSYFPSVFTITSTDVWIAGANNGSAFSSFIYHFDGGTWNDCSAALKSAIGALHSQTNSLITSIWASGTNDVYFVDANYGHNQVYHTANQGATFTVIDVDPSNAVTFNAINGLTSSNIYLAGYAGNIYHYNGSTWSKETLPISPAYIATDDYLGMYTDGTTFYACGKNILKK